MCLCLGRLRSSYNKKKAQYHEINQPQTPKKIQTPPIIQNTFIKNNKNNHPTNNNNDNDNNLTTDHQHLQEQYSTTSTSSAFNSSSSAFSNDENDKKQPDFFFMDGPLALGPREESALTFSRRKKPQNDLPFMEGMTLGSIFGKPTKLEREASANFAKSISQKNSIEPPINNNNNRVPKKGLPSALTKKDSNNIPNLETELSPSCILEDDDDDLVFDAKIQGKSHQQLSTYFQSEAPNNNHKDTNSTTLNGLNLGVSAAVPPKTSSSLSLLVEYKKVNVHNNNNNNNTMMLTSSIKSSLTSPMTVIRKPEGDVHLEEVDGTG